MDQRYKLTCEHCQFVEGLPRVFRGNSQPAKEDIVYIYQVYNEIFQDSKKPGGCGVCLANVIDNIRKVSKKYCQELCQTQTTMTKPETSLEDSEKETTGKETLQDVPKARRTSRPKRSAKRTKD